VLQSLTHYSLASNFRCIIFRFRQVIQKLVPLFGRPHNNELNRTGLEPVSALNFLLYDKDYFIVNKFSPYFYLKKQRFFVKNLFFQATKVTYYRFLALLKSSINFFNRVCLD